MKTVDRLKCKGKNRVGRWEYSEEIGVTGFKNTPICAAQSSVFLNGVAGLEINPDTLCWWTGHQDFYEHDIVDCTCEDSPDPYVIVWDGDNGQWSIAKPDDMRPCGSFALYLRENHSVKIIGNIHDEKAG